MIEPTFLSLEEVLTLHADQLERYGGAPGIRDLGLLEAAVETPRATFDGELLHGGLFVMAAAYAFHIAESQAFVDGNKRSGLNAALIFLLINGWHVPDPGGLLYSWRFPILTTTGRSSRAGKPNRLTLETAPESRGAGAGSLGSVHAAQPRVRVTASGYVHARCGLWTYGGGWEP